MAIAPCIEIKVSELASDQTILFDKSGGFDLADIVLNKVETKVKPEESEVKKAIHRFIDKNRAVKLLIDAFGLDTENSILAEEPLQDE